MQSVEGSKRNRSTTATERFSKGAGCAFSIEAPGSSSKKVPLLAENHAKFTQEAITNI